MALETVLLTVGTNAGGRVTELTNAVLDVAGPTGSSVVLLHVFSDDGFDEALERLDYDSSNPPSPDRVAARLGVVRTITDAFADAGIEYEIRGTVGDRAESILATADRCGADMVFVGGRKRSPTGKAVFGSTAQQVMLNAPCPVTFVRQGIEP